MSLRRIAVILIALILGGIIAFGHASEWRMGRKGAGPIVAQLQAEMSFKAALMYHSMEMGIQASQFESRARMELAKELRGKNPDPRLRVSLAILLGEEGRLSAANTELLIARQEFQEQQHHGGGANVRMASALQRIYSGQALRPSEIPQIRAALSPEESLFRQVAMIRAYRNAGMDKQADSLRKDLERSASYEFIAFGMLLGVLFLGGMFGVGLDIWFIHLWTHNKLPEKSWTLGAWPLFEGFVAWMAATVILRYGMDALSDRRALASGAPRHLALLLGLLILTDLAMMAASLVPVQLWLKKTGSALHEIGLTTRDFWRNVGWGIGGYLGVLPIMGIALILVSVLTRLFPRVTTPPNTAVGIVMGAKSPLAILLTFILVAVVAPLVEETVFRGIVYGAVRRRWGIAPGILISSALFAILHQQLPLGFIPIFLLGAAFALLYEARGSLIPNIIAHGINNAMVLLIMRILMG